MNNIFVISQFLWGYFIMLKRHQYLSIFLAYHPHRCHSRIRCAQGSDTTARLHRRIRQQFHCQDRTLRGLRRKNGAGRYAYWRRRLAGNRHNANGNAYVQEGRHGNPLSAVSADSVPQPDVQHADYAGTKPHRRHSGLRHRRTQSLPLVYRIPNR